MRLYFNQITPNIISKGSENNNVTIVPKIVKNDLPTNNNTYTRWPEDCAIKKYKFNANPIRHYRKQYVNTNTNKTTTFSNLSLIGNLDKPGANIVTNVNSPNDDSTNCNLSIYTYLDKYVGCQTLNGDKFYDPSLNKMICVSFNPSALVIKTASTNLSHSYASSHKEYLYNKNKTFNQNLPLTTNESISVNSGKILGETYDGETICRSFNPSNKKFQCQGPVTSSARISSLKYSCDDSVHCKKTYINTLNDNDPLSKKKVSPACIGCVNDVVDTTEIRRKPLIRRKRINILK
jgi:hypothetical protein